MPDIVNNKIAKLPVTKREIVKQAVESASSAKALPTKLNLSVSMPKADMVDRSGKAGLSVKDAKSLVGAAEKPAKVEDATPLIATPEAVKTTSTKVTMPAMKAEVKDVSTEKAASVSGIEKTKTVNAPVPKRDEASAPVVNTTAMSDEIKMAKSRIDKVDKVAQLKAVTAVAKPDTTETDAMFAQELDSLEGYGFIDAEGRAGIQAKLDVGDYEGAAEAVYAAYDAGNAAKAGKHLEEITPYCSPEEMRAMETAITNKDWDGFYQSYNNAIAGAESRQGAQTTATANTAESTANRAAELKAQIPSLQGEARAQAVQEWKAEVLNGLGATYASDEEIAAATKEMEALEDSLKFGDSDVDLTEVRASGIIKMVEDGDIQLSEEAMQGYTEKVEAWKRGECSQEEVKQYVIDNLPQTAEIQAAEEKLADLKAKKMAYEYYADGVDAMAECIGMEVNDTVNESEQDTTYRTVNHLQVITASGNSYQQNSSSDFYYMTDEQRQYYNTIYKTKGLEAANEFAERTKWMAMANHAQQDREYYEKRIAEGGVVSNILRNAGTVAAFLGGIPAAANTLVKTVKGEYADTNSRIYTADRFRGTTRSATYEKIVGENGNGLRKAGGWVYNALMSSADAASMILLQTLGVPSAVTASGYFADEFNSSFQSAKERGAGQTKAAIFGVAMGTVAALAEKYSLDRIIDLSDVSGKTGKELVKAIAKNAGKSSVIEGSEEGVEAIAGTVMDAIIMGDASERNLRIQEYEQTMEHKDAVLKAIGDDVLNFLSSVGAGAFSGGLLSLAGSGANAIKTKQQNEQVIATVSEAVASGDPEQQTAAVLLISGKPISVEQAQAIIDGCPQVAENLGLDVSQGAEALAKQVQEGAKANETANLNGETTNPVNEAVNEAAKDVAETINGNAAMANGKTEAAVKSMLENKEKASVVFESIREDGTREQLDAANKGAVESMTEEEMTELITDMKDAGLWQTKDMSRMLDTVAKKSTDLRQKLFEIIEKPFNEASGQHGRRTTSETKRVVDKLAELGINNEESSATLQRYGEGCYQAQAEVTVQMVDENQFEVKSKDDNGRTFEGTLTEKEIRKHFGDDASHILETATRDGNTHDFTTSIAPYTEEMLIQDVGIDEASRYKEADAFARETYNYYIDAINKMMERIYPNVYEKDEQTLTGMRNAQKKAENAVKAQQDAVNSLKEKLAAAKASVETHMPGTAVRAKTETKVANIGIDIKNAEARLDVLTAKKAVQDQKLSDFEEAVRNGDTLRNKRIQKREDYYHHFKEMEKGIGGLKNLLASNQSIDPKLAQISENTKPKSKWTDFMQKRLGGKYQEDAVNGLSRYIQTAEYILAYDPLIAQMRTLEKNIDKRAQTMKDAGNSAASNSDSFRAWLHEWTNTLCGKSNQLDRAMFKTGTGRKITKLIQMWNSQVIGNTLPFNVRSSAVQLSNITNTLAYVKNPKYYKQALIAMAHRNTDGSLEGIFEQSNFLSQRYKDATTMKVGKLESVREFGNAMLGALDNVSSELTWWAAYYQYKDSNGDVGEKNKFREYESAVDYADDITRRTHGGRGVGELPNIMTSKAVNFVAPFQVEIMNTYQSAKQKLQKGDALGIINAEIGIFALNTVSQALFGDRVIGLDFINAIIESVCGFFDEDEDEPVENAIQQFGGQLIGGIPYAQSVLSFFMSEETLDTLFGDSSPSRYGTGTMSTNAFSQLIGLGVKAIKSIKDEKSDGVDLWDVADVAKYFLPYGGNQLVRSAKGIDSMIKGYSENAKGKVQFATGESYGDGVLGKAAEWMQAAAFGKYATPAGQKYLGNYDRIQQAVNPQPEYKLLSENQTAAFKEWKQSGNSGADYYRWKTKMAADGAGTQTLIEDDSLTPEKRAQIDKAFIHDSAKVNGAKVVKTDGTVLVDYTNETWYKASQYKGSINKHSCYEGVTDAIAAGMCANEEEALNQWDAFKTAGKGGFSQDEFDKVCEDLEFTAEQRTWWAEYLGKKA